MTGPSGLEKQHKHNWQGGRSSGSAQPELCYLAVGKVVRAHGLAGEVSMAVLTEFPERFETTEWLYLGDPYQATAYRLESYRWHKQHILLTLGGVTDRTGAEKLRGQWVQVPLAEAMPLPEGAYYFHQLIGLEVITTTGERLGVVTSIIETGANDVYVVEDRGREILLPAVADVIKSIDLEQGQILVEVIEGLI
ncbi:MAG: 16S rRNA processing protein RimM [Anaerolineae bacterium]|nr:16S rRNA processing protein RimM [Anaerolineae bacterium]